MRVAQERLARPAFGVVIVGEFNKGKSTLVNALLKTDVCPVDVDVATAAPTIVRCGQSPHAVVHVPEQWPPVRRGDDGRPVDPAVEHAEEDRLRAVPIPLDELARHVTLGVHDGRPIRSIEVTLNRALLRTGLFFVDTPGVGLESAHAQLALGTLAMAEGVLFVTDAAQEMTEPELRFLETVCSRSSTVMCVVTKADLYPEWRRIVDLNRKRVAEAGLDVRVVGVSSFLRLRAAARRDAGLNAESGYPAVLEFLRTAVLERAGAALAAGVEAEVGFVLDQLRIQLAAEQSVLEVPTRAADVVHRLSADAARTKNLHDPTAGWQRALADGIEDLIANVLHDLQNRLRQLSRNAVAVLDNGDPMEMWTEFDPWLRRQVAAEAVANADYLAERTAELTRRVADSFGLAAGVESTFPVAAPLPALEKIEMSYEPGSRRARRNALLINTARNSYSGMLMFGTAGALIGLPIVAPVAAAVGLGVLGRWALREERQRQLAQRRQEAKAKATMYVDEALFVLSKDCRDALRRAQRELREEFNRRAAILHASSSTALTQAQRAMTLESSDRDRRKAEVAAGLGQLESLDRSMPAIPAQGADRRER
nr:dynamin family protein [Motilibacter deserti]